MKIPQYKTFRLIGINFYFAFESEPNRVFKKISKSKIREFGTNITTICRKSNQLSIEYGQNIEDFLAPIIVPVKKGKFTTFGELPLGEIFHFPDDPLTQYQRITKYQYKNLGDERATVLRKLKTPVFKLDFKSN